jgi:streptogramin lyase
LECCEQAEGGCVAAGLEDIVLTPEQLSKLAEAGLPDCSKVTIADQDDVTFELQKGRLGKDSEGSTVIVRGGMDYDSYTGTVSVYSPLGAGPDGIHVDENGKVLQCTQTPTLHVL